jgi:mannobiose 2-epimerase
VAAPTSTLGTPDVDPLDTVTAYAQLVRTRLPKSILPYWLRASRDDLAGGYLLRDDFMRGPVRRVGHAVVRRTRPAGSDDKHLVSQARLVWVFAHAHRHGYGTGSVYLDAAHCGQRFLLEHFRDHDREGFRWTTDRLGRPANDVKLLYGQSFVMYAFVELARASGAREPLDDALALFRAVECELHDDHDGGWREHADWDWSPLRDGDPRAELPLVGRKTANAMVHWLEAITALYAETDDAEVGRALIETVDLCRRHVFPADPSDAHDALLPDWTPDPARARLASYGHNVEYAWLVVRAYEALGQQPDWRHFHAYVEHTLQCGFDHERGGAFTFGHGNDPATDRQKVWWVQCELMAALTVALAERDDERYARALAQTVAFVEDSMTDRRDGILLEAVEEDGRRRRPRKSGRWKAGYHELRAEVMLTEAFAAPPR